MSLMRQREYLCSAEMAGFCLGPFKSYAFVCYQYFGETIRSYGKIRTQSINEKLVIYLDI